MDRVNVANLRARSTDFARAARNRALKLDDLRAMIRNQARLPADQADLGERVAAFGSQGRLNGAASRRRRALSYQER